MMSTDVTEIECKGEFCPALGEMMSKVSDQKGQFEAQKSGWLIINQCVGFEGCYIDRFNMEEIGDTIDATT